MDTTLGLSLTPTSVSWVLVEGRDAHGTIVDHDDIAVQAGGGVRAVNTSEHATSAVLHVQSVTARSEQRLHVIGVTWSDEAAAEAALLLEALTDAGFDNVVPIRCQHAADMVARGIAPLAGYDKAAVCLLDGGSTTVVMVDSCDGEDQTAVKHLPGGADRLVAWLTAVFDRSSWQPHGVVVVGADDELDALSRQLERAVPVPVITQAGTQLALARGAALAAAQSTAFADTDVVGTFAGRRREREGSRRGAYAGPLTMLVAGAVTFVASLSLAMGPRLVPDRTPGPVHQVVHRAASAPVAPAPAPPRVEVPAARPAPPPSPVEEPAAAPAAAEPQSVVSGQPTGGLPAAQPVPPPPPPVEPPPPPPPNPHPLLTKLLEHIYGHQNDPAPDQSVPPPNP